MSTRERMTWGEDKRASLPVEEADKRASVPPAVPMDPDHPAAKPDPDEHQYENGDTSSWAEDPHPGPYPNSEAPAVPNDPGHPAAKTAADIRIAAEKKAAKCIRVAQTLLPGMDVPTVEDQALELMDLPDASLDATLRRIEAAHEDEEVLLRKMLAGDEDEEEVEEEEVVEKEASTNHMAEVLTALRDLQTQINDLRNPVTAGDDDDDEDEDKEASVDDDEVLLASMLEEEGMTDKAAEDESEDEEEAKEASEIDEDEVLLAQMLAEMDSGCEGCDEATAMEEELVEEEVVAPVADVIEDDMIMDDPMMDAETDISLDMMDDPMGLNNDLDYLPEDEAALSSLFHMAADDNDEGKEAGDDAEEADDEDEGKEASERPQPKKASAGPKTLGNQTMTKAASSEMAELGKLWETAPDVSKFFE